MQSFLKTICALIFLFCFFGLLAQNEGKHLSVKEADTLYSASHLIEKAKLLESDKKIEAAIQVYDEVLQIYLKENNPVGFEECSSNIYELISLLNPQNYFDYCLEKINQSEDTFGKESPQTGLWNYHLGVLHMLVIHIETSKSYLKKSLQIFKNNSNRHKEVITCRIAFETILLFENHYQQARDSIEKTFGLIQEALDRNLISKHDSELQKAESYINLATTYSLTREDQHAVGYLDTAISIGLAKTELDILIKGHRQMATVYTNLHNYKQAEEYCLNAISYSDLKYGKNSNRNAPFYNILGRIYTHQEKFTEAQEYLDKALKMYLEFAGEAYQGTYFTMTNLAHLYTTLSKDEKAESTLHSAIKIGEKIFPEDSFNKLHATHMLCILWLNQAKKQDSAIILFNKSLEIGKSFYGEHSPNLELFYRGMQIANMQLGNFEGAMVNLQKGLIINSYNFRDLDFSANPPADDVINMLNGLFALRQKNILLFELWKNDKSNTDLVKQIQACSDSFYALLTRQTKSFGEELAENADFLNRLNWFIYGNIPVNYELYKYTEGDNFINNYYRWMEKLKGQQLMLSFQITEAQKYGNIPETLIEQDHNLTYTIDSLNNSLQRAIMKKGNNASTNINSGFLLEARRKRESFINELEKKYPNYYQLKYDFEPVSLTDLQGLLDENTLYVEISINYQENPRSAYFLVLTDKEQHVFKKELPESPVHYIQKSTTYNKLLRSHNLLRTDRRRKFIELSHELYQNFVQPFEHLLEGKEQLVIVGEHVTHYIPFETLLKNNEERPWNEMDFLIRDHEISYHYSGTLFARTQTQSHQKKFENELFAFAPVFSDDDNTLTALRDGGLVMADSTFRSVKGDNFSPLLHSEKEVKSISQLFSETSKVNVLLKEDATESNLKSALEQNYRFVHIASHSFANMDYPKFSGIACETSSSDTEKDDGILYVGEIYNLAINSDLVVLSSCESGVGHLLDGEGMLGLNRSFVYAGVPNVIFSLWKVYDESTSIMMTEFYKQVLKGESYSKALRISKLKMLENPTTAAPDIWAAFLFVGGN